MFILVIVLALAMLAGAAWLLSVGVPLLLADPGNFWGWIIVIGGLALVSALLTVRNNS